MKKNSSKIFKTPALKIIKYGAGNLIRFFRGKPMVYNLNLNVTNICNQNCPMCNAVIVGKGGGVSINLDRFMEISKALGRYPIASLTISGGEPSLVKDIAPILDYAGGRYPFGINVNTNLYASWNIIGPFAEAALRNNIRIGTSFDGFGETADRLRGAKNVSARVSENIRLITGLKKDIKSSSTLNMHTVISDSNIDQVPEILEMSGEMGWSQTLAPVNTFFYQDSSNPDVPALNYSEKLEKLIQLALTKKNISVSREFLTSIPSFIKGETDKYCPYLTGIFRVFKIFVDPGGEMSLCSRQPIGNILNESIESILKKDDYTRDRESYLRCPGCWMACFVEILLASPAFYRKRIVNRFAGK